MKFDEKEVIDSFDEEFSRKKKSADPKKTKGSIANFTPLFFVIGALVLCALCFLVLKLLKKDEPVPAMTLTAEISLAGVTQNTEAVVIINDSATVIPVVSATEVTEDPETGSRNEEAIPTQSDESSTFSHAVSATETQEVVPTVISGSDGASDYAQVIPSKETQAAVSTVDSVSESDGSSDYSQPVSITEIPLFVPTLNSVSESDRSSDYSQSVSATEIPPVVPTLNSVSKSDFASDYSQPVSSAEIPPVVSTLNSVSKSDFTSDYSQSVSATEIPPVIPTLNSVSKSDFASDYSQPVSATEIPPVIPTLNSVSKSDFTSDYSQPVSATEIPPVIPTLNSVSKSDFTSDYSQSVSATEIPPLVPTSNPVSKSDFTSDYSQSVSATEIPPVIPTLNSVSKSDFTSDYSQSVSATEIPSVIPTLNPVSESNGSSDYSHAVSSAETQPVIPPVNGSSESDEPFVEKTRIVVTVQNTNSETDGSSITSADSREPFATEPVSIGSTSQKIQTVVSENKTVSVNNVPVRLTEEPEIPVPETETPVSASYSEISPWTDVSMPQPTDVPVFGILSAEEILAISSAEHSATEIPSASAPMTVDEPASIDPAPSEDVLPSPTATMPIPTETPVPTQTPMPTPAPDTRNWFQKMIDKVFRRETPAPTATLMLPTATVPSENEETEAAEFTVRTLTPVTSAEESPTAAAVEPVPSSSSEYQSDENRINAPVPEDQETQSDFGKKSSPVENRESQSEGIPSAPLSPVQSENTQTEAIVPTEAVKGLDPEPVYSPVNVVENNQDEIIIAGVSDEKTADAMSGKQQVSVPDERIETGTTQIADPKGQTTVNTEVPVESEYVEAKAASTPKWAPDMNYATAVVMNLSDTDIISLKEMGILEPEVIDDGPNETPVPTRIPETPKPTEAESGVQATIIPVTRTKQPRAGKTQIVVRTSRTMTPVSKQAELPKTGGAEDLNLPLYAGLLAMLSAIVLVLRAIRKKE